MRIDIVSLFPEFFDAFKDHSIMKRAMEAGLLSLTVTNPRDFSHNKHNQVDDTPFGGGVGMLVMAPPIFEAVESIPRNEGKSRVIFLGPTGRTFNQEIAKELATYDQLIFVCGHYEGVDYRVESELVDETLSIGDFVLTGGELPAMVVVDAVARMLPGVLGARAGAIEDSFYEPLLEAPHYTKQREFRGMIVPEVLLSGHHANIERWRLKESLKRTKELRPDLLERELSKLEQKLLKEIEKEEQDEC